MPLRLGPEARERPPVLDGTWPNLTVDESSQWERDWHRPSGVSGVHICIDEYDMGNSSGGHLSAWSLCVCRGKIVPWKGKTLALRELGNH